MSQPGPQAKGASDEAVLLLLLLLLLLLAYSQKG